MPVVDKGAAQPRGPRASVVRGRQQNPAFGGDEDGVGADPWAVVVLAGAGLLGEKLEERAAVLDDTLSRIWAQRGDGGRGQPAPPLF